MLKKIVLVFTCFFYPFIMSGAAPEEKTYVQLEDLIFDQRGIWLNDKTHQHLIPIEALRVDSEGFYVQEKTEQSWSCPKCGKVNPGRPYGRGCIKCSWPYDGSH